MGSGCLFGLGRWVARACFRLGAILASVFITTVAFVLFGVIGPLCLGMSRELIGRLAGGWPGGKKWGPTASPLGRAGYALLGGLLWVLGYGVLRAMAWLLSRCLAPAIPTKQGSIIALALVFVLGVVVGALAYEYEKGHLSGS
ncbi:MAG: hypothetical protein H5T64_10510 [Chloroflexi bacterium]|nr:hypothetical protein [Chloroflexota bacterium]